MLRKQTMSRLVVHLSPAYFSPESNIGGGERYAEELARAMSARENVRFISFGPRQIREQLTPSYERVILKNRSKKRMMPFSEHLFSALVSADIIHCHQYFVLPTFLAAAFGKLMGKKVFVSDLGGAGWTPGFHVDQSRWISAHLPISQYAAKNLPGRNKNHCVILGGIDMALYQMRSELEHDGSIVFLGRILPHKGIHYLIAGLPEKSVLKVIGPVGNQDYYNQLVHQARGKSVQFISGLSDGEVMAHLLSAMALVHATPVDQHGQAGANELFGLAPVEAMASGCVPILSEAASLPELIDDKRSGLLVPPNDPTAIRNAILTLQEDKRYWRQLSLGARKRAEEKFSWEKVVDRCLHAYALA